MQTIPTQLPNNKRIALTNSLLAGVTQKKNSFENLRIMLINAIAIFNIVFLSVGYLIMCTQNDFLKHVWILLFIPHSLYVLQLNKQGKTTLAKTILVSVNILSIGLFAVVYRGFAIEYNLIFSVCLTLLVFTKTRSVIGFTLLSLATFFVAKYICSIYPEVDYNNSSHHIITSLSLIFTVLFTLIMVITIQRLINNYSRTITTENKLIETQLQTSSSMLNDYKQALDQAAIVTITDTEGHITYANQNFFRISKYNMNEIAGKNQRIFNSGYHPKAFWKELWITIQQGKIWKGEVRNRAKDGSLYWVDTTIVPFLNKDRTPYQYLVIRYDITERKQMEEEIQESSAQQNAILNALPANIALLDKEGYIMAVNESWKSFANSNGLRSRNYCVGNNYISISKNATGNEKASGILIAEGIKEILAGTKEEFEMEYPCNSPDEGRWFYVKVVPSKNGHLSGAVVMHLNITDRKNAETKILELNESLEQKVNSRTSLLQDANRELEAFNYTVSHDLQAPLRSLSGFSKILLSDYQNKLDNEGREIVQIIDRSAAQMGKLINDLLNFSKLGKTSIQKKAVNMNELLSTIIDELHFSRPSLTAEIKINELQPTQGDQALLRQVWVNLIENAIKYSSKKEKPVIEIGMKLINQEWVYYVKDNGAGFDMHQSDKLFKVFHRLHSNDDFEGTGVGLATIHRIIGKHEGRVWAEGIKDIGAIFYFTLPETVS